MSSISVKIPTAKFIKAVEDRLAQLVKWRDDEKGRADRHQKAVDAWEKKVASLVPKSAKPKVHIKTWNGLEVELTYSFEANDKRFPPRPEPEKGVELCGYELRNAITELENALRLLKLSDAEHINAGTYKSVSRYL